MIALGPEERTAATVENDFWGLQNTDLGIRTDSAAFCSSVPARGTFYRTMGNLYEKCNEEFFSGVRIHQIVGISTQKPD